MQYAIVAVVVTVVLGSALFFGFNRVGFDGVVGLAIATSLAAWVNVGLLAGTLMRENIYRPGRALLSRLARVGLAAAAMGLLVFAASVFYQDLARLLTKEIAVLAAVAAGGAVYGIAALLFGAVTRRELKSALRREKGAAVPTVEL
jgi:putative peptidoglycan lipid II flippase